MGLTIPFLAAGLLAAEAALLLLASLPAGRPIRAAINSVMLRVVQPLLFSIPLALLLLTDVIFKYSSIKDCTGEFCTAADRDRFKKATVKNERNLILSAGLVLLYWLLWRVVALQSHILHLESAKPKKTG